MQNTKLSQVSDQQKSESTIEIWFNVKRFRVDFSLYINREKNRYSYQKISESKSDYYYTVYKYLTNYKIFGTYYQNLVSVT